MSKPAQPKPVSEGTKTQEKVLAATDVLKKSKLVEVRLAELGGIVEGRVSLRKNANFLTFVLWDGTAEIQVVAKGDQWKKFSEEMKDDDCYRITAFKTRKNNGGYNTTFHACEIHLIKISLLDRIDGKPLPEYPFTKVDEVSKTALNKLVNMIVIVYNVEPEEESNPKTTRLVNIVDETLKFVTLRLWGDLKASLDESEGKCVTLYNLKVRKDETWLPRNVDNTTDTKVKLEVDSERARELQKWFDERGRGEKFTYVVN